MFKLNEKEIYPIWQPVGYSTHEIARKLAELLGVKTSHTGTLDPMARGVVIVLAGDTRLKKYENAKWEKTYTFDILFGFETDTYDGMGLITKDNFKTIITKEKIEKIFSSFHGDYSQTVPIFSTLKVGGKSLHTHFRNNTYQDIKLPIRNGVIRDIKLLNIQNAFLGDEINKITTNIKSIDGDFRQDEIIKQYESLLLKNSKIQVQIAKFNVKMTKGLYVRSLAMDICKKLNALGICINIVRTNNGDYSKINSLTINELFKDQYRTL